MRAGFEPPRQLRCDSALCGRRAIRPAAARARTLLAVIALIGEHGLAELAEHRAQILGEQVKPPEYPGLVAALGELQFDHHIPGVFLRVIGPSFSTNVARCAWGLSSGRN